MFWAATVENKLIEPFRVPQGLKINSVTYCRFLEDNFLPWLEDQPLLRRTNFLFMQDNAPAHASKCIKDFYSLTDFMDGLPWIGLQIVQI